MMVKKSGLTSVKAVWFKIMEQIQIFNNFLENKYGPFYFIIVAGTLIFITQSAMHKGYNINIGLLSLEKAN